MSFSRTTDSVHERYPTADVSVNNDGFVKSRKTVFLVIPAPHLMRDKLQPESSIFKEL